MDLPGSHLIKEQSSEQDPKDVVLFSEATELYLRLKGTDKAERFPRRERSIWKLDRPGFHHHQSSLQFCLLGIWIGSEEPVLRRLYEPD